jgi:hypothetical protein
MKEIWTVRTDDGARSKLPPSSGTAIFAVVLLKYLQVVRLLVVRCFEGSRAKVLARFLVYSGGTCCCPS